jgi:exosortase/archaeosortase
MAKRFFVIAWSLFGVIALFVTFIEFNKTNLLLALLFFLFAFLEEKTDLLVVKCSSRLTFVMLVSFIITIISLGYLSFLKQERDKEQAIQKLLEQMSTEEQMQLLRTGGHE